MKPYLPPVTHPWRRAIERRHEPKEGAYSSFRPCLRWEFGFSCAFCLLHQTDLMRAEVDGWGLMEIEHFEPQSQTPSRRNDYKICFLICTRCNKQRGASLNQDESGNVLLDPCSVAWAEHFESVDDRLLPRSQDSNAAYTWTTYGLDDPSKVVLRGKRRYWMKRCAERVAALRNLESQLADQVVAMADSRPTAELLERLELALELNATQRVFLDLLAGYTPVPRNSDAACRCGHDRHHDLPEVLAEQTVDLEDLFAQVREATPDGHPG
jgi:hypothetical protein